MRKRRTKNGRRLGLQIVTLCISVTMVLVLLGVVVFSILTARNLQQNLRENVEISVLLGDTVSVTDGMALVHVIKGEDYAREVDYISREKALALAKEEMGFDPSEFAGGNPFTPELSVKINAEYANVDSLECIADALRQDSRVVEVDYTKDEIDGMNHLIEPIGICLLTLAGLLIFICYTLIRNTVQLNVYSRRFTIHTMKLVGASWSFIRYPFMRQATSIALIAAILSCALIAAIGYVAHPYMPHIDSIVTWRELAITVGSIFVFSYAIMMICTYVAVNKFLRMSAGELYNI